MSVCSILVTSPVEKAYDYLIPEGMELALGDYVSVPLGPRVVHGVVWAVAEGGESGGDVVPSSKLKSVLVRHDLPPMEAVQRQFIDWVATYNMERRGSVLKMAISVPQALEPAQPMTGYILGENANKALAPTGRGLGEGDLCEGGDSHPPKEFHAKPPAYCIQNAIHLRQNQTDVEKKLWHVLKDRRLAGYKFRRQHPIPPYIADFVCIEKN